MQLLLQRPLTVAFNGGVCVLAGLLFRWKLPGLRGEARQLILASQMAGGEPAHSIGSIMTAPD